jgi:ethanolamine ammonia-lyase large subunit
MPPRMIAISTMAMNGATVQAAYQALSSDSHVNGSDDLVEKCGSVLNEFASLGSQQHVSTRSLATVWQKVQVGVRRRGIPADVVRGSFARDEGCRPLPLPAHRAS